MKIDIGINSLKDSVSELSSFIPSNPSGISEYLLMEVDIDNKRLDIQFSRVDLSIKSSTPIELEPNGHSGKVSVVCNANHAMNIIDSLKSKKGATVSIDIDKAIQFKTESNITAIPMFNSTLPALLNIPDNGDTIKGNQVDTFLSHVINAAKFASDNITITDNYVIGTDGKQFCALYHTIDNVNGSLYRSISKHLKKIRSIYKSSTIEKVLHNTPTEYHISAGNVMYSFRKINDDQRVIHLINALKSIDGLSTVTIPRIQTIDTIKMMLNIDLYAQCNIINNKMKLSTTSKTKGESTSLIDITNDNNLSLTTKINLNNFKDMLSCLSVKDVPLLTKSDTTPFIIKLDNNILATTKCN